jgi:hypothetical protein
MSFFSSHIFTFSNDLNKDINERFNGYDYWEEYDETKFYPVNVFGNNKKYINCLYHITDGNQNKLYVISREEYTIEELKTLMKFCPCEYCQMYWFNPKRFIICPHCIGCIKTLLPDSVNPGYVKQARLCVSGASPH